MKCFTYGLFFKKIWCYFGVPTPLPKADYLSFFSYDNLELPGFKKRAGLTTVINLENDLEIIWKNFRENFIRKQIIKGEKNGITVNSSNNFKGFKKVYHSFRSDKKLPKDNYQILQKNGILFTATYQGQIVAGGIFISDGQNIRALVLSSLRIRVKDGRKREIIGQANRLVTWEAIKYAKKTGHKLFDLGGIAPDSDLPGNRSLAEFKEAFGGERKAGYYYTKVNSPLLKLIRKIIK